MEHQADDGGGALRDAVAKVKLLAKAKFDETIELAVRLGLDPRKTEQSVRGTVSMPSGTGKTVRIAVFALASDLTLATASAGECNVSRS